MTMTAFKLLTRIVNPHGISKSITTIWSRNLSLNSTNMSKYFMLTYNYVPDVLEKRAPLRAEHLELAGKYLQQGKVLLGGAFANPIDSAAIIFKTDSKSDVEDFVNADPYVLKGLVTKWTIREWTVVIDGTAKI
ncbi:unnamed protein product [Orchesella dallaii]|uniref:YCII-related domain-containing protein n=1 Tax=Orchesella dallaii TaxID=48710 RepID=A0ABP1Q8X2_9HEXA